MKKKNLKMFSTLTLASTLLLVMGFAACGKREVKNNGIVLKDRLTEDKVQPTPTPTPTPAPGRPVPAPVKGAVIGEIKNLKLETLNNNGASVYHLIGDINLNTIDYIFDAAQPGTTVTDQRAMFLLNEGLVYGSSQSLRPTTKYFSWGSAEFAAYVTAACVHASYFETTVSATTNAACAYVVVEVKVVDEFDELVERKAAFYQVSGTTGEAVELEKLSEKEASEATADTISDEELMREAMSNL
jgi:hypothetical protein